MSNKLTTVKEAGQLLKGMTSNKILGANPAFRDALKGLETPKEILDAINGVINEDDIAKNDFLKAIQNVLSKSYLVDNGKFKTTMSNFYKDATSDFGGYIREVSFDLPEARKFNFDDEENENVFKKKVPVAHQVLHVINEQIILELTVSDTELSKVTQSIQEFSAWLNGIKEDLKLKASIIEEDYLRKLMQVVYANEGATKVSISKDLTHADKALATLKVLKNESFYMSRPNTYSLKGVVKATPQESQVIIIRKDVLTDIQMDSLATAFNMNQRDIESRILVIDTFGKGFEDLQAVLMDFNAIIYEGRVNKFKSIENPKGLYTNIFYHKHDIVDFSPFRPVVFIDLATPVEPEPTEPETKETEVK